MTAHPPRFPACQIKFLANRAILLVASSVLSNQLPHIELTLVPYAFTLLSTFGVPSQCGGADYDFRHQARVYLELDTCCSGETSARRVGGWGYNMGCCNC